MPYVVISFAIRKGLVYIAWRSKLLYMMGKSRRMQSLEKERMDNG